jgi:D-xylulose reductase
MRTSKASTSPTDQALNQQTPTSRTQYDIHNGRQICEHSPYFPARQSLKLTIAPSQNLSFVLSKPNSVTFEDRPVPTLQSPYDVLVAVNYTGICGSDVHYWTHGAIGHFVVKDPMVLGHESAGTIVQVGSAVKDLKEGDRVALEPGYPDRRCANCLAGKYNLCPNMKFAATPPYDGTLTGFWVAPNDFCYKLPENVSLQEGALIEPLAVGVHVVKQAGVKPGDSVVVMGAGPVGLLCAAVAKAYGATKIVSVDIVQSKLDFAKDFAATHTYISQRISAEENAKNLLKEAGIPDGADVVIDASGAEPSIQAALHAVKVGGSYVQAGMGKPDINFPIMAFCIKEVTAKGSFRYGAGDYKLAVELVAAGKVDVKKLVSETVRFKQAEEAFEKVKQGQVIKILIAGPNEGEDAATEATEPKEPKAEVKEGKSEDGPKKEEAPVVHAASSAQDAVPVVDEKASTQPKAAQSEENSAPSGSAVEVSTPAADSKPADTSSDPVPSKAEESSVPTTEKKAEPVVPVHEQEKKHDELPSDSAAASQSFAESIPAHKTEETKQTGS